MGRERGYSSHTFFFNFALSLYKSFAFGYLLPWIISGGMNTVLKINEVENLKFSTVKAKICNSRIDWKMMVACSNLYCFHLCDKML